MSQMSSPDTNGRPGPQSLGAAAKDVVDHARTLVKLEIELATRELKRKLQTLGVGIGLFVGAAFLALFGIGFLLATIAAGLATFLPTWLALLIVTLVIFLVIGVLVQVGQENGQEGDAGAARTGDRGSKADDGGALARCPARTDEDVRRDIEAERERLVQTVDSLRDGVGRLRRKLQRAALAAVATGVLVVTARRLLRRGRR